MDDLLSEFLTETAESISVLDLEIVKLEQNPNDPELLGNIFRLVHTIKGTCGFLGLPRLEAVAHAGENVLGKFRDGELEVTPDAVSIILESLDCIKDLLATLEATESEPPGSDEDLISRLNAYAEGHAVPAASNSEPSPADEPGASKESEDFSVENEANKEESTPEAQVEPAAPTVPAPSETAEKPSSAEAATTKKATPIKQSSEPSIANQSIRVGVDLLENLMTMVSELVLTRNSLLQMVRGNSDSEFNTPLQRLNHITAELQEGVMKTRMQPIGNAWAKLPRIIRDLSVDLNKKIDLQMLGAETELDRQVLELIKNPLIHMVRNAADHGIEKPSDRVKAGKPAMGTVTLNAYHEDGHIIVEITDGGRGIAVERIKEKAIANGLASEAEMAAISDQVALQYIFKPGLSTTEKVTSVSGRGVGMDVVKTNVEKIGGTIELQSEPGKGSTVLVKIPLTLAIVSALIVECRGQRFAIPQLGVVELVRASANSDHKVEKINNAAVLRLRDRLLPLVYLDRTLRLNDADIPETDEEDHFIVVTQVGANTLGVIVDQVFDTEEIVVKPVAPMLRDIGIFAGNTILGDGSVVMILDTNGIAAAAGQQAIGSSEEAKTEGPASSSEEECVSMLIFRAGGDTPKAVPLALIARLEEIDRSTIEMYDDRPVVQYRDHLMPLVPVTAEQVYSGDGRQPILVFADGDRSMGLIVDEIVDIVDEQLEIKLSGERAGLVGSAVLASNATEIVDAGYYLTQAYGDWFKRTHGSEGQPTTERKRVLLVDDSPFFRNLLSPLLAGAGYEVVTAEDGDEALELLEKNPEFDAIVSDIEMPRMSGFDFAKACRGSERWRDTPILALSSRTSPDDLDRGREAGFTDYVAKFDRDALLSALSESFTLTRGVA